MGCWEMYCSFCAGPLGSVREAFLQHLTEDGDEDNWPPKDGEWSNPKGFPVPTKPIEEIVRLTDEDNEFWEDTVCVGPMFKPSWVSPPCVGGSYGDISIGGSSRWQNRTDERYNIIHIRCLSLLCRRLDITPEEWWLSFHGPESNYTDKYPSEILDDMLLPGIDYYDMEGRNGESFEYALADCDDDGVEWWDPDTYEDCNWLFAAPSTFPRVPDLPPPLKESPASRPRPSDTASQRVLLFTPELLYTILDFAVPYVTQDIVRRQLCWQPEIYDCPTVVRAQSTVLSMLQVNKRIYNAIIQGRQDLFFRLIWQFGWMLPACPADWKSWNAVNDSLPPLTGVPIDMIPGKFNPNRTTTLSNAKDWRAYMIIYLRNSNNNYLHTVNRYRFHRMHIQHARGHEDNLEDGGKRKWWSCGKYGVGTALECPEPYEWEKDEWLTEGREKEDNDEEDEEEEEEDEEEDSDGEEDTNGGRI